MIEQADYRIIRNVDGIRHVTRIHWNGSTAIATMWWKDRPEKPYRREYFDSLDDARKYADDCNHEAWRRDAKDMFSY